MLWKFLINSCSQCSGASVASAVLIWWSVRCALSALSSDFERDLPAVEEDNLGDFPHGHCWWALTQPSWVLTQPFRAITQPSWAIVEALLAHCGIIQTPRSSKYIDRRYGKIPCGRKQAPALFCVCVNCDYSRDCRYEWAVMINQPWSLALYPLWKHKKRKLFCLN